MGDEPSGLVPVLLRLYPAAWRERYGDELTELIDGQRLSLRGVFDLLRGALDAHCNLADLIGGWSAMTSRLRSTAVTTITAWVLFSVAASVLVKSTEDPAFGDASHSHAALAVSYTAVQGAFALAGVSVLVGGLPLVGVAMRQAWRGRDAVLGGLLGVPVLAAVAVAAYLRVVPPMADVHSVGNVALFAGLLVLGGAGTVGTVVAVRAAVYRVELPAGLLRWAGWLALVAAGAISGGVLALAAYGWVLRTDEPVLFGSANGLLATPLPTNYLATLALGIIAAVAADRAAVGASHYAHGAESVFYQLISQLARERACTTLGYCSIRPPRPCANSPGEATNWTSGSWTSC